jgi:hypothetical protein
MDVETSQPVYEYDYFGEICFVPCLGLLYVPAGDS